MSRRLLSALAVASLLAVTVGCTTLGGSGGSGSDVDLAKVRRFEGHPLLWLGERFEKWELEHVELDNRNFVSLVYGNCKVEDPDGFFGPEGGSCSPPLQIQISPLCSHLDVVARSPIWKRRMIRGAPVGTIDSAPVLFTNRLQVKVYRGQGSDPGLPLRALRALRSANGVPPVIDADDLIPAPPREVLAGKRPCRG